MNLDCTIRRTKSCKVSSPKPAERFYRTKKSISGVCKACLKFALKNDYYTWKNVPFITEEEATIEIVHRM